MARDLERALPVLLQAHGLGRVRANTALVNWHASNDPSVIESRSRLLRVFLHFGINLVMLSATAEDLARLEEGLEKRLYIDVWHRDNASGRLMLMLAYLMTRSRTWEDATLRVFVPRGHDTTEEQARERIEMQLEDYRIVAEPVIVERADTRAIVENSASSAMVFLPLRLAGAAAELALDADLHEVTQVLGITALVLGAQDLELDAELDLSPLSIGSYPYLCVHAASGVSGLRTLQIDPHGCRSPARSRYRVGAIPDSRERSGRRRLPPVPGQTGCPAC